MICARSFNDVRHNWIIGRAYVKPAIVCQRFRVGPGFEEGQGVEEPGKARRCFACAGPCGQPQHDLLAS
jgi:hypothetical protein